VAEVTQKYFGTISMKYDENRSESREGVSILIQKNEKIPCSITRTFYTSHDGQEIIDCQITEAGSAETDPRFVHIVASKELSLPPNRPAGQEIEITYSFDDSQIMHTSFVDVESGKKTEIKLSVTASSESGSNKIDKFTVE
jgi:molecular chaperone DnaK